MSLVSAIFFENAPREEFLRIKETFLCYKVKEKISLN